MATIKDLATHPDAYVRVSALAHYWNVDPKAIYQDIDKGALVVERHGHSGRIRIPIAEARRYGAPQGWNRRELRMTDIPILPGHGGADDYQIVELRGGPGAGVFRIRAPSADAVVSAGEAYVHRSPGLYVHNGMPAAPAVAAAL
jgi:hypothetical protein